MKKRLVAVVRVVEVAAKRYTFGLYRDCITENVINKSILFSNKHIYAICLKALGTKSKLIYLYRWDCVYIVLCMYERMCVYNFVISFKK